MKNNLQNIFAVILVSIVFSKIANAQQKLIHYWHFNNLVNFTTVAVSPSTFPAVKANYSTLDTNKAVLAMKPLAGTVGNALTYWDNVSPGDTVNARLGVPAGLGFRPRNPTDSMQLMLYIPSTGYQNITIKYEAQKSSASNGAATNAFDYSLDSGYTWKTSGLSITSASNGTGTWTTTPGISVNINNDALASNNNKLVFRIRFIGPGNTGTSGNVRLDNISVEGDTVYQSGSFVNGNVAVLRIGDSLTTLANTGNPLAIDQFTVNGNYVSTYNLPKTGANAVTLSSTATSEGQLSIAGNNNSIVFFAYKTAPPYTGSLASSTSAVVNRTFVSINNAGVLTLPSFTSTGYSANNPRCAYSNGVGGFWGAGANTGISYGSLSSNADTIVSSTITNIRSINAFAGQLYFSSASGTAGIYRAGNGIPTNSGNISTNYLATGTGSSPYTFSINSDSTICYIADDRASSAGGGIQKWTRTGSAWTLQYTLSVGNAVGARGLVVNWNTASPTIFATSAEATRNRLVKFLDSNSTATVVTLDTAGTNTIYRGVTFIPVASTLPVKLMKFGAILNNNDELLLNWKTSSEINNNGFYVERSMDGVNFKNIGFVKGFGNSNSIHDYQYIDHIQLNNQAVYYRLKQADFNGAFEYSNIAMVNSKITENSNYVLYPNPANNTINITNAANELTSIEIVNVIVQKVFALKSNSSIEQIDISGFKSGIYFVNIVEQSSGKITTLKFLKSN